MDAIASYVAACPGAAGHRTTDAVLALLDERDAGRDEA
jgi:hypothetical protein